MADAALIEGLRSSLAADDYHLSYDVHDGAADVTIVAGPDACAECLVPKPLMRSMLAPMLGVEADRIELAYPVDVHSGE